MNSIGFMQGRLSEIIDGKIQAFPWNSWMQEMDIAIENSFSIMEWTLDHKNLKDNPLFNTRHQKYIQDFCSKNKFQISSLTGDCFMQAPLWKLDESRYDFLFNEFKMVVLACKKIGIKIIVIPCVDFSSLDKPEYEDRFIKFSENSANFLRENNVKVAIESDFSPIRLADFMSKIPNDVFGVNYDIGNSASLGFLPKEEIDAYGELIINVHVKDRPYGKSTIALGEGDADFLTVFSLLNSIKYQGNFILQTARAKDGKHLENLLKYKKMVKNWQNV